MILIIFNGITKSKEKENFFSTAGPKEDSGSGKGRQQEIQQLLKDRGVMVGSARMGHRGPQHRNAHCEGAGGQ